MSDVATDRVSGALLQLHLTTAAGALEAHVQAAAQRDFSPLSNIS